jgi:hypothetical protein
LIYQSAKGLPDATQAIDTEWPALRAAFRQWRDPANFTATGEQRVRRSNLTAPLLYTRG